MYYTVKISSSFLSLFLAANLFLLIYKFLVVESILKHGFKLNSRNDADNDIVMRFCLLKDIFDYLVIFSSKKHGMYVNFFLNRYLSYSIGRLLSPAAAALKLLIQFIPDLVQE